jgi:hypothetical protein
MFQLRDNSKEVHFHFEVYNFTELNRRQAAMIPQGGDWRWLPNVDVIGPEGAILGNKLWVTFTIRFK